MDALDVSYVMLAFLQTDCRNSQLRDELSSLDQEIKSSRDINCNGPMQDYEDIESDSCSKTVFPQGPMQDYEAIESDSCSSTVVPLSIQPFLVGQIGHLVDEPPIQQVAEELRIIADLLEQSVMARATQSLHSSIKTSPSQEWTKLLSSEVDKVMGQAVCLKDLQQERVIMALTFTLVKGVCEQTPKLLRGLFHTALQYIRAVGTR